jgi:hypothetical protein
MTKQTYFREPKYSKNYLIPSPQNLYEQYVNAFAFSEMVKSQNAAPNKRELQQHAQSSWREIRAKDKDRIHSLISELLKTPIQPSPFNFFSQKKTIVEPSISPPTSPISNLPNNDNIHFSLNAIAQKKSHSIINQAKADLYEYNNILQTATSSALRSQFSSKIKKLEGTIMMEENKIKQLKGNAAAQNRVREKKRQKLNKENIVEIYDAPGRPSYLINNPDLLEKMHSSIEFGAADHKRRKEIIKVRTIKHLREKMEENYNIYMSKSTVKNYMQPRHPGTREANRHHHPAQIRLAAVGRNEMNDHVDEHYCLASVKGVKLFAMAFPQNVVLISQDDKAKVNYFIILISFSFSFN